MLRGWGKIMPSTPKSILPGKFLIADAHGKITENGHWNTPVVELLIRYRARNSLICSAMFSFIFVQYTCKNVFLKLIFFHAYSFWPHSFRSKHCNLFLIFFNVNKIISRALLTSYVRLWLDNLHSKFLWL